MMSTMSILVQNRLFIFSPYVHQEKQRAKIKEKLDKCVKEKLVDFCYVFDIQVHNKAAVRKVRVRD